jgi:hypothetical protein
MQGMNGSTGRPGNSGRVGPLGETVSYLLEKASTSWWLFAGYERRPRRKGSHGSSRGTRTDGRYGKAALRG